MSRRHYHTREINRGVYGDFSKITEEYEELVDADSQNNKLMCLMEISDFLGALTGYYKELYNEDWFENNTFKPPYVSTKNVYYTKEKIYRHLRSYINMFEKFKNRKTVVDKVFNLILIKIHLLIDIYKEIDIDDIMIMTKKTISCYA